LKLFCSFSNQLINEKKNFESKLITTQSHYLGRLNAAPDLNKQNDFILCLQLKKQTIAGQY